MDNFVSAAVYIFGMYNNEWCILAGKRSGNDFRFQGGLFNVPVGMREPNESSVENARRECYEETGINLPSNLFRLVGQEQWDYNKVGANYLVILDDVNKYEIGEGDWENEKFFWMAVNEVNNYRWAYGMDRTIRDIFSRYINKQKLTENKLRKIIRKSLIEIIKKR